LRTGGFDPQPYVPTYGLPVRRPRFQHDTRKHVLLFVATAITTTLVGALHYYDFASDFGRRPVALDWWLLVRGLWYSLSILAILGAHEMGHYWFCRRYDVDATLPFFIPAPLPLTGTLGAVIRIREPFPTRKVLFDIGVAGPIAGFVTLLPLLFIGMMLSRVTSEPTEGGGFLLGIPLLFDWAGKFVFGELPSGQTVSLHPMVFAAWFGMLATAINLLPFGQLDGGHITYATLGRWSTPLSLLTVAAAIAMTFVSRSWIFMTVMMVLMLLILGPRHPRVINEYEPLGKARVGVAILALVILVLCFTPAPLEPYELMRTPQTQSAHR
jgi:membrane-associated protease RseP (regulator of RpoE activity)